jgi:NitT/TauT family transport system ATP-binding protein
MLDRGHPEPALVPASAPALALSDISLRFGSHQVLSGVSLRVARGEFISVVGPTGCGKSTLLNLITGLLKPTGGTVEISGEPLKGISERVGYMLQQDALLPWKTALDNVALGLIFRNVATAQAREQAAHWLKVVGLAGAEAKYPHELSGGMKKRVAMAQSLILEPELILMDEPFSALDVHTRRLMENELLRLWTEHRATVVFITHDLEEAIALSDRVAVMAAGPGSRVIAEVDIDLPRPRDVAEIVLNQRFHELHKEIWGVLRDEVQKSYARLA